MTKRRKRWLIAIGVVAFLALAVVATMRNPKSDADVALVSRSRPFEVELDPDIPGVVNTETRLYSLHVAYDDAVKSVMKELSAKGWSADVTYEIAIFVSPNEEERVMVMRGRVIQNVDPQAADTSVSPNPAMNQLLAGGKDDKGWVMVDSQRRLSKPSVAFHKLMKRLGIGQQARVHARRFALPKKGDSDQPVDVIKGSMQLEDSESKCVALIKLP